MVENGFVVFDSHSGPLRWASAAFAAALDIAADPECRRANLRHGQTWFAGVDALPNARDGSINGVPLAGPWDAQLSFVPDWHPAQLSIVYPGYPGRDTDESAANHRYRVDRAAAHVDGLLPIGSKRRRFLREPHAFVLGLPLNDVAASPLVVWPGSHVIMGDAFRAAVRTDPPEQVDLTEVYLEARRSVFASIAPLKIQIKPGQSVLLHRHLLHGVSPWETGLKGPPEGRMIAYFRPQFSAKDWLSNRE